VCHHGHRVHRDDRRHHRDDRRSRRHHRDDRRSRREHHPALRRADQELRHETDEHPGDRPWCDLASCPGSDAEPLGGDRRHRQEPDGHPADEAFPGWEQRGCCPDGQPTARRGPLAARGPHGHLAACPDSAQTGCCRGEELRVGAPGAEHPHLPHGPPVPRAQASWPLGPAAREQGLSGLEPWEREPSEPGPSGRGSPDVTERRARSPSPEPEPQPEPRELSEPQEQPPSEPGALREQPGQPVPAHWAPGQREPSQLARPELLDRAWHPMAWPLVLRGLA
jgi:hypothetical protein